MFITGKVKVHKSDGVVRHAEAAKVLDNGSVALWDETPGDEFGFAVVSPGAGFQLVDKRTQEIIEPDLIAQPDKWDRVEREGHSWKQTSAGAIKERAKRRDDVDEDEIEL